MGLVDYAGGEYDSSQKLKSTSWHSGTDDYGFAALPGGNYYQDQCNSFGETGYATFWTSTKVPDNENYYYYLGINWERAWATGGSNKLNGHSVRCVRK